jgi:calcineurin-like phosphoesterase family protein
MATFLTSDTHFFHKNILKYQPEDRPFKDVDDMHVELIGRWNEVVGPNDTVYHLGDVGFAKPSKVASMLSLMNGKIELVIGNHDKGLLKDKDFRARFERVDSYREIKHNGTHIVLCHYPILSWNRCHHGSLHFYGHTHGSIPHVAEGWSMDVGVDTNKCYPYNLDELIEYLANVREMKGIEKFDPRYREERENE